MIRSHVLTSVGVVLTSIFLFYASSDSDQSVAEATPMLEEGVDRLPQVIKSVSLDKVYAIADEPLPMDNFDALERLERELLVNSYWHSSTLLNIKHSYRYFPIIEPILAEEGVPDDFKYVAVIESNLRNATSPAGAKGLWQFMSAVAKDYGLEIRTEVDERYHLEKSTRAACKHIKHYRKRFGNWTNAMGAYNMGETRFARERSRQGMDSYYDMNFGAETSRYLFRVLAVKEIMENPQDYGFYAQPEGDLYKPLKDCQIVTVDQSIASLGEFAKEHGTSYRMLKVYNPWLISSKLTVPAGKTYEIKIPS